MQRGHIIFFCEMVNVINKYLINNIFISDIPKAMPAFYDFPKLFKGALSVGELDSPRVAPKSFSTTVTNYKV
nr:MULTISPECIES: hypothetical protein [unclassified Moorena]